MLRRIGAEEGVAPEAFDRVEASADGLPSGRIEDIVEAFQTVSARIAVTKND